MKCYYRSHFPVVFGSPWQYLSSSLITSGLLYFSWYLSAFTFDNGFGVPEFCHCYHVFSLGEREKEPRTGYLGNYLNLSSFETIKTNWTHFLELQRQAFALHIQKSECYATACIVSEVKIGVLVIFWPSDLKWIFWSWTLCQQILTFLLLTDL